MKGVSFEQQCLWNEICELLFMHNDQRQDIDAAFFLACTCEHPDAKYLVSLFVELETPITKEEARNMFLAQPNTDSRALIFSEFVITPSFRHWNVNRILKSAEMGYAFAQSTIALFFSVDMSEKFKYAKFAADQGEYNGYFVLGNCYEFGYGCDIDENKAKECYQFAADRGHNGAMSYMGMLFPLEHPKHWIWLGRAARAGSSNRFINHLFVLNFPPTCVFQIGYFLNNHVDAVGCKLFNQKVDSKVLMFNTQKAVEFYKSQISAYRAAVDTWTMIARRLGVVKDMRRVIGSMIWNARGEAEYACLENNGFKELQD